MIQAIIVMNDQGKPRLVKFYNYQTVEKQQEIIRRIYGDLCSRPQNASNFIQADSVLGSDAQLVYKTYATLYFIFVFDDSENELAILDLMFWLRVRDVDFIEDDGYRLFGGGALALAVTCQVTSLFSGWLDPVPTSVNWMLTVIGLAKCFVFVETLDKCFSNVRELDILFNFNKVHTILDEIILGGQVLETSSTDVVKAVEEISWLEKSSSSIIRVPKAVSNWQGR